MKRANGTGRIRHDRARKRYEVRLTLTGPASQGDREDASRHMAAGATSCAGCRPPARPGLTADVTLAAYLERWITEVLPLSRMQKSTIDNYGRVVGLYVIPPMGSVKLDELAPAHVRSMLASCVSEGSRRTRNDSPAPCCAALCAPRRATGW